MQDALRDEGPLFVDDDGKTEGGDVRIAQRPSDLKPDRGVRYSECCNRRMRVRWNDGMRRQLVDGSDISTEFDGCRGWNSEPTGKFDTVGEGV